MSSYAASAQTQCMTNQRIYQDGRGLVKALFMYLVYEIEYFKRIYLLSNLHDSFPEIFGFNAMTVVTHLMIHNILNDKRLKYMYSIIISNSHRYPNLLTQT